MRLDVRSLDARVFRLDVKNTPLVPDVIVEAKHRRRRLRHVNAPSMSDPEGYHATRSHGTDHFPHAATLDIRCARRCAKSLSKPLVQAAHALEQQPIRRIVDHALRGSEVGIEHEISFF